MVLGRPHSKSLGGAQDALNTNFPPPKTDKPRPHVCATCNRGFARLEHLKRHERSHTKEKPFACDQCTRCFARRDLLLRHQQKLHLTAPPSSRAKGSRRESTASTTNSATGRIRKNSMAASSGSSATGSMRPRANTISHVDTSALGMTPNGNSSGIQQHNVGGGLDQAGMNGFHGYRGMSTASGQHGNSHGLPRLETKNRHMSIADSLQTAPAYGGFGGNLDMNNSWNQQGSTINPAQLHFVGSPQSFGFDQSMQSPFQQSFPGIEQIQGSMDSEIHFPWLSSFENQMSFGNEQAVENSSPSTDSDASPDHMSDVMIDQSNPSEFWQTASMSQPTAPTMSMDFSSQQFPDVYSLGHISPKSMNKTSAADVFYSTPPPLPSQPSLYPGMDHQYFQPIPPKSETPSNSAASISSSNPRSSVTSLSTDSITDVTRNALLSSLSQQSKFGYGNFKTTQPQVSSPLSPGFQQSRSQSISSVPLPSTDDLQRYVGAYIQYFHPHLPFLHIPSLNFDSPAFSSSLRASSGHFEYGQSGIAGGGGALILAMAAIGALYEFEAGSAKELFDMSRTMIRLYTGERRKADMAAAGMNQGSADSAENTPLWLVQAMLLNVIYGHNCGDKVAANIASTLCSSVINLARSARLTHQATHFQGPLHSEMEMDYPTAELHNEWHVWKVEEERKRTLYAIFILSSLLVSAYNHAPALMNSEIRLDLPCDDTLWAAENAELWKALGGSASAHEVPFAAALTSLLTAHQREQHIGRRLSNQHEQSLPEVEFKPSSFGCLVLINALHNYIWETRQRHTGLEWTTQETEAMHARIEPALRAWQAAWSLNPQHSMERPNPFGASSLSADCIPLLDLAYLRLFVNLGRSKEAFFQRDFNAMAEELASGQEIVQHAEHSTISSPSLGGSTAVSSTSGGSPRGGHIEVDARMKRGESPSQTPGGPSKRERHLRKAAFYAANSLTLSGKLAVTFADFNSRELPLQSALLAFDCAQVLAEWISTLQQRVGPHLGILGKDNIDFADISTVMFLEQQDCELIEKINQIIVNIDTKLRHGDMDNETPNELQGRGYGSQMLQVHARMFEKASIWPRKSTPLQNPNRLKLMCRSSRTRNVRVPPHPGSAYPSKGREFSQTIIVNGFSPNKHS